MTQAEFFQLYIATLVTIGGLAGYVITHLLSEIKRLNTRVDEIYNILLDRQNNLMARKAKALEDQGYTPLEAYCIGLNEYYKALRKAGFPVDICLSMIMDPFSYPEWILPKRVNDNPSNLPDFYPDDDED